MKMIITGHRGARGLALENTAASIEAALAYAIGEIEIDVRITKDGVAILYHDETAVTTTGPTMRIADHTYDELIAAAPTITTLSEAIELINRRVPLVIEVKPSEPTEPVIGIIQSFLDRGWTSTELSVSSFDQAILLAIHHALPGVTTIVNENWSSVRARHRAAGLGTKRITMNQKWLWFGFIHAMHAGGYQLSAYTVNKPRRSGWWDRAGLYALITDYPDRFAAKR